MPKILQAENRCGCAVANLHAPVASRALDGANPWVKACGALTDGIAVGRELAESESVPFRDMPEGVKRVGIFLFHVDGTSGNERLH